MYSMGLLTLRMYGWFYEVFCFGGYTVGLMRRRIRSQEAARLGKPEGAGACCLGLRGRGASIGPVPHRYHIGSHRSVIGRGATLSAW